MNGISTHVLDTARGVPARGVTVVLESYEAHLVWHHLNEAATDDDGRVRELLPEARELVPGRYRLTFHTGAYWEQSGMLTFHPHVAVEFEVRDPAAHYHVPLLVSPFGYTTYRGT